MQNVTETYFTLCFKFENIFNISDFRGWGVKSRASHSICYVFMYSICVEENRVTIYWYEFLTGNIHGIGYFMFTFCYIFLILSVLYYLSFLSLSKYLSFQMNCMKEKGNEKQIWNLKEPESDDGAICMSV